MEVLHFYMRLAHAKRCQRESLAQRAERKLIKKRNIALLSQNKRLLPNRGGLFKWAIPVNPSIPVDCLTRPVTRVYAHTRFRFCVEFALWLGQGEAIALHVDDEQHDRFEFHKSLK